MNNLLDGEMVIWATTMIVFCCLFNDIHASLLTVDYNSSNDVKKLPRFWMNTGFAPPEPLDKVADFLESDDVNLNLEIIGSLPNNGIKNVRIHWLLNLLTIRCLLLSDKVFKPSLKSSFFQVVTTH